MLSFLIVFGHASALPDDGTFTDNWGNTGIFTYAPGTASDTLRAAVYQSDGKLVVAGLSHNGSYYDMAVARLHPDGSLDRSFDTDGVAIISNALGDSIAHSVALDSMGRIVVAGRAWGFSDFDFATARLLTDGSLDTSYGGGLTRVDIGGNEFARGMGIDSNQRIVIGGYSNQAGKFEFAAVRLLSDASLDTNFDSDGMLTTAIGAVGDYGVALTLQSDDKIIIAGQSDVGATPRFAVARYRTDGSLDTSFSGDGMDAWAIGVTDDVAWAVTLGTDNYVHLAGRSYAGGNYRMAVASYTTNGTRDTSGTYIVGSGGIARDIVLDQGKITLTGRSYNGANWDLALIRLSSISGGTTGDTGFNGNGVAITSIGTTDEIAYALAVQSDGKVIAAGTTFGSNYNFGLVRYRSTGALDTSFDTDGRATTDFAGANDVAYAVTIANDHKIIAAGFTDAGAQNNFAVARYLTNGSLDTAFSSDGLVNTNIGSGNAVANAVVTRSDDRIYAAGTSYNGSNADFTVVRYHTNGNLDTAFSTDGIVTTDFNSADDGANAMALDANRMIVVAGYARNGANRNFAIARYRTDGSLDTAFSGDGKQTISFAASSDDMAYGIAIQSDGRIVLGGHSHNNTQTHFAMARLLTNGTLDASFDGDGMAVSSIDTTHGTQAHALVLQSEKIVLAGRSLQLENRAILARFNSNGSADTSFGTSGYYVQSFSTGDDVYYGVAVDSTNRIVAVGHALNANMDFLAVRVLNTSASSLGLDPTFDGDGIVITTVGAGDDISIGMAYKSGMLSLVGRSHNGTNFDFAAARYNFDGGLAASGALDKSFGNSGVTTTAVSGNHDLAHAVAVQSDNKVIVAGATYNGSDDDMLVLRYTSGGALDTSFDSDGIVSIAPGTGDDRAYDIALDGNNKIVLAGMSANGAINRFVVARYLSNGAPDTGFDGDGVALTTFGSTSDDVAFAVAVQSDNKVIVGGYTHNNTVNGFALARYGTNGSLDATFDGDGRVTTQVDSNAGSELHDILIQPDGRIVAVGRTLRPRQLIAVVRYLTSGALDTSFNTTGILTTSATSGSNVAYGVAYDNGKLIITGIGRGTSTYDFVVARLNSNGSPDTSFSADGFATKAINTNDEFGYATVVQGNGKVLAAGFSFGSGYDFAVTRFTTDGSADSNFGSSGAVTTDINGTDVAQAIALTPDGRIVVAGHSKNGADYDVSVARYFP
ncbi:MAG: hypothetical protein R3B54_13820 [Bdellovibrionota bacterium]